MNLDSLDKELLEIFAEEHPRPASIEFCDFDVAKKDMVALCQGKEPYLDFGLIESFAWNVTHGLFGEWTNFPAFAGYIAIVARRKSFTFPYDFTYFHLHLGKYGSFSNRAKDVVGKWAFDMVYPWEKPIELRHHFETTEHALDLLAIANKFGQSPSQVIERNLEYCESKQKPTALVLALGNSFLDNPSEINEHFNLSKSAFSNQDPPAGLDYLVEADAIELIVQAVLEWGPFLDNWAKTWWPH